jgi:CRP-like cAMP-binding protein
MAEYDNKIDYLGQTQLFSDLTLEERSSVAGRVAIREFKKGQVILLEEDTNKYMYSVLSGEVKVFYTTMEGKESIVAFHGAGASFGEISLIDQQTIPATVVALERSMVLIIGRDDFFEIVRTQPKVMHKLLLLLTGRMRLAWNQVRMLHFKDASYRIMTSIKDLSTERGEPAPEGVLLKMRLTHQNIADLTGLTRETVTRVIDKWKKRGLLSLDENRHMLISHEIFEENVIL